MNINKIKILRYVLVFISIILNFLFYKTMGIFFLIMGVTVDSIKSELFSFSFQKKNKLIFLIACLPVLFSLMATMGNFNTVTKIDTEKVITEEWENHQKLIDTQQKIVNEAQKNLDNMPTLDEYKGDISSLHSTNLTKITKEYNTKNEELNNILNVENQKLIEIQSKNIEKYKTVEVEPKEGYLLLFNNISNLIGVDKLILIQLISILFAVTLETTIIILTQMDSEKKEDSQEYILQDAIKKISIESTQTIIEQLKNLNKNQSSDERLDKKSEVQTSSSSSNEKINQSNPIFKDQIKNIGLDKSKDFNEVREVACNNDSQSLSLESKDQNVKMKQSSSSDKDQIRLDKDKSSDKKIGFQTSSSDDNKKIGFEVLNPKLEQIKKYLIENKMQGKQFPVAKITDFMNCKRYEIDDLKPLLISEKIIYKSNTKSYKVNEKLGE